MKKLILAILFSCSLSVPALALCGVAQIQASDPAIYLRLGSFEFTYPLAHTNAISLYDFWKGEGLIGAETPLVTWHSFNLNVGVITSMQADGAPFASLDFNFAEIDSNLPPFFQRLGIWYGHDFKNNDNRAGIKSAFPLW
jgi:hypothetical protein